MSKTDAKNILLIISGGIAAYKSLELIRLMRKQGHNVRAILTKGGAQFVTPLSVSSLCEHEVYTDLWSLKDETEMGHIRLSREADLIVIAPASADLLAKMAHGMADDLATTTLLASDAPIMIAPAMNHKMWDHPATQENIKTLNARGITQIGPEEGDMACGEHGMGRMSEPEDIAAAIQSFFLSPAHAKPFEGYSALVTSGPTFEAIDPVRFIGNRSSGKQGHAIASALANAGAHVTLVSGPVDENLNNTLPSAVHLIKVESAQDMLASSENALPYDIAVCAAAVSDWRAESPAEQKIKKDGNAPSLALSENPDILKTLSAHTQRPKLVIGFAAETQDLLDNAAAKLEKKGCDWILANEVNDRGKGFGAAENHVYLLTDQKEPENWNVMSKHDIAARLVERIAETLKHEKGQRHAA